MSLPLTGAAVLSRDDGSSLAEEYEKKSKWIIRTLVGSLTGRVVVSVYETLRTTGTSVMCLSPWGDSSLVTLPCIRFRDVVVHTVIAATGGVAAVAAPALEPVSDVVASAVSGENIIIEALAKGFTFAGEEANVLLAEKPLGLFLKDRTKLLRTEHVKILQITLKYKHANVEDAAIGFFRSSLHADAASMFSSVKDYFRVEKGWFSPYLYASSRRPDIPRSTQPDVIFCHGPFLFGDYQVGETLLKESAYTVVLCAAPLSDSPIDSPPPPSGSPLVSGEGERRRDRIAKLLHRSSEHGSEHKAPATVALPPRRMVILFVGIKPHRELWATSKRPGESVLKYLLFDRCPALVVPARSGAPLVAWHGMTVEKSLWSLKLPGEDEPDDKVGRGTFEGVVETIFEFLDICVVDWERIIVPAGAWKGEPKATLRDVVKMLVAAAVETRESKEVRKEVDEERCGIAMWRIP